MGLVFAVTGISEGDPGHWCCLLHLRGALDECDLHGWRLLRRLLHQLGRSIPIWQPVGGEGHLLTFVHPEIFQQAKEDTTVLREQYINNTRIT